MKKNTYKLRTIRRDYVNITEHAQGTMFPHLSHVLVGINIRYIKPIEQYTHSIKIQDFAAARLVEKKNLRNRMDRKKLHQL